MGLHHSKHYAGALRALKAIEDRTRKAGGEVVALRADDGQPGPDVVEHARAERQVRLEVGPVRAETEVGLVEKTERGKVHVPFAVIEADFALRAA